MSTFRVFVALRHGFLTAVVNYGFYYGNSCHAILDCSHDIALFKSSKKIFQESKKFRFNIICSSGSEFWTFEFKRTLHTDQCICAVSLCFWDSSSNWCKALFIILFNLYFTELWNGKLHISEKFMQFVFIFNHTSHISLAKFSYWKYVANGSSRCVNIAV
jgi:hypothetical protein